MSPMGPVLSNELHGIIDYKFFCLDGEPKFAFVSQDLDNLPKARVNFVDMEWTQCCSAAVIVCRSKSCRPGRRRSMKWSSLPESCRLAFHLFALDSP